MTNNLFLYLIFFICTLSIPKLLSAQSHFSRKEGKIVYEKVDSLEGFSKEELYGFSKKWFADTFKNAKYVIQSEDFETGQLIGKGETGIAHPEYKENRKLIWTDLITSTYKFTIQIDIKDQKYRLRIYDISRPFKFLLIDGSPIASSLEEIDKQFSQDKKKAEKWRATSPAISEHFIGIMESFSKKAIEVKNDDF